MSANRSATGGEDGQLGAQMTVMPAPVPDPSTKFEWRRCKDSPWSIIDQPTVIDQAVYVKAGSVVAQYMLESDSWKELPTPNVDDFTLSSFNGKLLLTGGWDLTTGLPFTHIVSFNDANGTWEKFCSDLPTPVAKPVVFGYGNCLIVAGGLDSSGQSISNVSLFSTDTNEWRRAISQPLPIVDRYNAAIVGDTVYLVGSENNALRAHIPTLMDGTGFGAWHVLPETPFFSSSPLPLKDQFLAVGGNDSEYGGNKTSAILFYDEVETKWKRLGDLPKPMDECGCANILGKVVVFNWKSVFIMI